MKKTKLALMQSVVALLLCVAMLIGSTFAWFTDSVTSGINHIVAGNLDVELEYRNQAGAWKPLTEDTNVFAENANWEPGYTEVVYLRVSNKGNLALKYQLGVNIVSETPSINIEGDPFRLSQFIHFGAVADRSDKFASRTEAVQAVTSSKLISEGYSKQNSLQPNGEQYVALVVYMPESVGNAANHATGQDVPTINLGISLVATQYTSESDSFDSTYDDQAQFPVLNLADSVSATAVKDASNKVAQALTMASDDNSLSANIPVGVQMDADTDILRLTVREMTTSGANITLGENEILRSLDVHIAGVAANNTVPMQITIAKAMMPGLNIGNYKIYHMDKGVKVQMTSAATLAELDAHNEFYYDPATGDMTLSLATFSEVALVADTVNAWNGTVATGFAGGEGTEDDPYLIANADQFVYFGDLISNDNGTYGDKYYKLIADINFGGEDNANKGILFYPIGYHAVGGELAALGVDDAPEFLYFDEDPDYARNSVNAAADGDSTWYTYGGSFKGMFDGNGHKISNIYQNTWQLKGNYSGNYWNAAMGLFGYVNGGTVKNLTVEEFSSDGEFTPTGVIAAYAANASFENIAIVKCNPRVYNTGNGGIVGIGGNSNDPDTHKLTFTNITIDNTNKISALWGSWDVACGGLVGMFRGAGHVYMTNCHVGAQIDVFNDVCGNYQYYWYRYSGMLIGTNKNMVTENGYTVPETSKFHAENCTVHFGEWNDYYYCELVANSLASYTHDHQFSRLEQISSLDEIKSGDTWTKTGNFLLISGDTKTCYHIVNKNGTLTRHLHTDAGEETVGGKTVLKEDKQIVYLPFNQLFTGYGWGVKHIPVYNGENYAFEGITILDREVANSVTKFESSVTELMNNKEYKLSDIFSFVDNGVNLVPGALTITVTNLDESNPVSAEFTRDSENWENGILELTGTGKVQITIQDYYFCTPTTITVDVVKRQPEVKFESKFTGDFLYRVGNAAGSTVALNSLFKAKDGAKIGNVSVTVEALNDTAASGTYTPNATWTNGKIQFSGTGIVKVTIYDDDYCIPTELTLEVVDAVNATTATSATANNVVLLNNVSGSFSVSGGYTLYGNDFTVTLPTTVQSKYSAGYVGYVTINNGNLDNVKIVGPNYPAMNIYREQAKDSSDDTKANYFYNSIYINGGNCTISNSYISGSRTAICIRGGNNITIDNTTVSGGAVANIEIAGASSVTLRDLTTFQNDQTDSYGQNKTSHGMGVYVTSGVCDIVTEGELIQRNWINKSQWSSLVDGYESFFPDFFGDAKYAAYQKSIDGVTHVNLAMIFACNWDKEAYLNTENQSNAATYTATSGIALQGYTGGVYSVTGTNPTTEDLKEPNYKSVGYNPVMPKFHFDNTANNDADDESNAADTYCVYDESNGILKVGITGDSKTLDLSKVAITKNGTVLAHTAYLNGSQISGNAVTIKGSDGAKQTLTFKATSNDAGYDKNGAPISGSIEYTWTVTVEVAVLSYPAPEWNMGGTYKFDTTNCVYAYYSTSNGYGEAVPIYEDIKVKYYNKQGQLVQLDLSGTTVLPTGSNNSNTNAFTYTLPDGSTLTMKFSSGWKSGATTHQFTVYNSKVYIYPQSLDNDNYIRAKTTNQDFNVNITYTFTDPNGQSTETVTMNWYNVKASNGNVSTVQWQTFDGDNGKKPSSCVTADTLVTLADGTQKRIDEVTYADQLLVWDFFKGELTAVPSAIIFDHGYGNNTVIELIFNDSTSVKVVNLHQFFDADLNKFISIDATNVADFVGHAFATQSGNTVTLVDYTVTEQYCEAWGIISAAHYNIIVEGLLSTDFMPEDYDLFNYFAVGSDMKFDEAKLQADIEQYGLYAYEDFADYLTYEQFVAFNVPYFKISVGKGVYTYEGILALIDTYLNN